jgi:Arc/MetJ-type ribon-helix-helix transcriptional regulator
LALHPTSTLRSSKLETLRRLIDEGETSGEPVDWDVNEFLNRMKKTPTCPKIKDFGYSQRLRKI